MSGLQATLEFVNYKLYQSINVKYPPILDPRLEVLAADLNALSRYLDANVPSVKTKAVTSSGSDQSKHGKFDEDELQLAEDAADDDEDAEIRECKNLFKNMKFFLNREVPRESTLSRIMESIRMFQRIILELQKRIESRR